LKISEIDHHFPFFVESTLGGVKTSSRYTPINSATINHRMSNKKKGDGDVA